MENPLQFADLPELLSRLRDGLLEWRVTAPGIWPLDEYQEEDVQLFFIDLYTLSWECLGMTCRINVPELRMKYIYGPVPDQKELVIITRQLLQICNPDLLQDYRDITIAKYEAVRLLEQSHAQLIYAVYADHPGIETVKTYECI